VESLPVSEPLAVTVARHAAQKPSGLAFRTADEELTWEEYARRSDRLAAEFIALGFCPGERLAVLLPDGPGVHIAYLATEKAGLLAVGIGPRAGFKELEHLLRKTQAAGLLSRSDHLGRSMGDFAHAMRDAELPLRKHLVVERELAEDDPIRVDAGGPSRPPTPSAEGPSRGGRGLGPSDLFLLNSTSGTTGMPKVVAHDQRRWQAFHELAVEAAQLCEDDVFMSVVAAPFGFGIWTSHITPTLLGAPTTVTPRFGASETLELIERHRVSVLAAVSTQFVLLLECPELRKYDLSSLRVLFTGGEVVPFARAAEFEERTQARVLQFYGSNET
jgi:acyl-CoA synthetase